MRSPSYTSRYTCRACVLLRPAGSSPGQGGLLRWRVYHHNAALNCDDDGTKPILCAQITCTPIGGGVISPGGVTGVAAASAPEGGTRQERRRGRRAASRSRARRGRPWRHQPRTTRAAATATTAAGHASQAFHEPRNQPISQRAENRPRAGTPMTESATGMMPAVMGDEGPGAQDPLIGPAS
jgi:hypothetical protein